MVHSDGKPRIRDFVAAVPGLYISGTALTAGYIVAVSFGTRKVNNLDFYSTTAQIAPILFLALGIELRTFQRGVDISAVEPFARHDDPIAKRRF
jgi:hypothetical protein